MKFHIDTEIFEYCDPGHMASKWMKRTCYMSSGLPLGTFVIFINICIGFTKICKIYSGKSNIHIRDPQLIVFSLLITTHEILSISESTVLKFHYSDSFVLTTTLIYKYVLQWVWVQRRHQTHNIRNIFDSYAYSFRFINRFPLETLASHTTPSAWSKLLSSNKLEYNL